MSRYFFHMVNGEFIPDAVEQECGSDYEVKSEAAEAAGSMIREQSLKIWQDFVCDEKNRTPLEHQFDAADLTGALSDGDTH